MDMTELPVDDLEFQRDCYVRLLEQEEDVSACRGYLRRIAKLDDQIAARDRINHVTKVEALVEVPIVLTEQLVAPPVRVVEVEVTTQAPVEEGIEIEIIEVHTDESSFDDRTTGRWKPEDGDFFETMDTVLYDPPQRTASYPAITRRFQPVVR